jgi:hypothetical protein
MLFEAVDSVVFSGDFVIFADEAVVFSGNSVVFSDDSTVFAGRFLGAGSIRKWAA